MSQDVSLCALKLLKDMFRCRVIDLIRACKELSEIINYKNNIKPSLTSGVYYRFNNRLIPEIKIIIFLLPFSGMIIGYFWFY